LAVTCAAAVMTSICLVREPAEAFDLKPDGNDTTLLFAHRGFKNADDEYASATTRWATIC
jgi:hypothetical protein